jgi:hypothetical protein
VLLHRSDATEPSPNQGVWQQHPPKQRNAIPRVRRARVARMAKGLGETEAHDPFDQKSPLKHAQARGKTPDQTKPRHERLHLRRRQTEGPAAARARVATGFERKAPARWSRGFAAVVSRGLLSPGIRASRPGAGLRLGLSPIAPALGWPLAHVRAGRSLFPAGSPSVVLALHELPALPPWWAMRASSQQIVVCRCSSAS